MVEHYCHRCERYWEHVLACTGACWRDCPDCEGDEDACVRYFTVNTTANCRVYQPSRLQAARQGGA